MIPATPHLRWKSEMKNENGVTVAKEPEPIAAAARQANRERRERHNSAILAEFTARERARKAAYKAAIVALRPAAKRAARSQKAA
jgi:hypothetical protein